MGLFFRPLFSFKLRKWQAVRSQPVCHFQVVLEKEIYNFFRLKNNIYLSRYNYKYSTSILTRILDAHQPHKLLGLLAVIVLREPGACPSSGAGLRGGRLILVGPQQLPFLHLQRDRGALLSDFGGPFRHKRVGDVGRDTLLFWHYILYFFCILTPCI